MYQPVIIIGAARSGTNMLRDVLTALPGFGTWPCDEINYIWRYGNARFPSDELTPEHAQPHVRRYIRRQFNALAVRRGLRFVVEKTCANSLRVPFVDAVFPDAKYVFLVRDGRDVVASARKCWRAPLRPMYLLRKARFVPWRDVPYYGCRYAYNRLYRLFSRQRRVATWGPRFHEMDAFARTHSLEETCAEQWRRSVDAAARALAGLEDGRVYSVRYEDFVAHPAEHLARICRFLGFPADGDVIRAAVASVSSRSVGNWRHELEPPVAARIQTMLEPYLEAWGYTTASDAGPRPLHASDLATPGRTPLRRPFESVSHAAGGLAHADTRTAGPPASPPQPASKTRGGTRINPSASAAESVLESDPSTKVAAPPNPCGGGERSLERPMTSPFPSRHPLTP